MPGGAVVADTQQAAIELITRQAADATATFLTGDYLRRSLGEIEQRAGAPVRYGLSARYEPAVDVDQDRPAARVVGIVVGAVDGGHLVATWWPPAPGGMSSRRSSAA
jgi:hypothetical protein